MDDIDDEFSPKEKRKMVNGVIEDDLKLRFRIKKALELIQFAIVMVESKQNWESTPKLHLLLTDIEEILTDPDYVTYHPPK